MGSVLQYVKDLLRLKSALTVVQSEKSDSQETSMDPITLITVWNCLCKYWWLLLIAIVAGYILYLRVDINANTKTIEQQKQAIASSAASIATLKSSIDNQNTAVNELAKKGKEQADRLDQAIIKINSMKPAQVVIHEIYADKSTNVNKLLLDALSD